jgi:DNA-binding transcriptional LysR family regulator
MIGLRSENNINTEAFMRLRNLRYFLAVAEELNFTRAAARVHIEPSPLARVIREVESDWDVHLIQHQAGHLRLTRAGEVFRDEARRILSVTESARDRVRSAEQGYRGQLRLGLADHLAQPQLVQLLARCREEEPLTEVRILEMSAGEMIEALNYGQIDAGFTIHPEPGETLRKETVWWDRFAVAMPRNHPLRSLPRIPLREVIRYPLLLFPSESCPEGYELIRQRLFDPPSYSPRIAEYVSGHELMLMLAAAGHGIGVGLKSRIALYRHPEVIVRHITDVPAMATFLVIPDTPLSEELRHFVARARQIGRTTSRHREARQLRSRMKSDVFCSQIERKCRQFPGEIGGKPEATPRKSSGVCPDRH